MSLVRWNPYAEFDSMLNRMMPPAFINRPRLPVEGGVAWAPSADISETEKEFCIRAELPAVKKEDVTVTLDDGVITIKGERRQEKEVKEQKFHQMETFFGSFERRFGLPENVNAEGVRCDYKDGMLSIHLPKTEVKKPAPKHITVQ